MKWRAVKSFSAMIQKLMEICRFVWSRVVSMKRGIKKYFQLDTVNYKEYIVIDISCIHSVRV